VYISNLHALSVISSPDRVRNGLRRTKRSPDVVEDRRDVPAKERLTATPSYHTSGRLGQPEGETALRSRMRQVSRYWNTNYGTPLASEVQLDSSGE